MVLGPPEGLGGVGEGQQLHHRGGNQRTEQRRHLFGVIVFYGQSLTKPEENLPPTSLLFFDASSLISLGQQVPNHSPFLTIIPFGRPGRGPGL